MARFNTSWFSTYEHEQERYYQIYPDGNRWLISEYITGFAPDGTLPEPSTLLPCNWELIPRSTFNRLRFT